MFFIKQGDTSPAIQASLRSQSNRSVNLTGATAKFHMSTEDGKVEVNKPAAIVNATEGIVRYLWATGDTANVGLHFGEFEITYADSTIETFPNSENIKIKIIGQIV